MSSVFVISLLAFIVVSTAMILIILVQRPQGGGLAGAFGGAGATSSESVFGGRVGDVLTNVTIGAFVLYLALAITLTLVPASEAPPAELAEEPAVTPADPTGSGQSSGIPPAQGTSLEGMRPEDIEALRRGAENITREGGRLPDEFLESLNEAQGQLNDTPATDDGTGGGTTDDGGTP